MTQNDEPYYTVTVRRRYVQELNEKFIIQARNKRLASERALKMAEKGADDGLLFLTEDPTLGATTTYRVTEAKEE